MRVFAVVLSWNDLESTRRCLRSLRDSRTAVAVVVVDNGSTDGSPAAIAREFPEVELLALPENRGFCGGCNAGAARALERGAEALFFLNNDAWVDPHFLTPLVRELERDATVGAVGSLVLFADDRARVWCLGGRLRFRENVSELGSFGRPASELGSAPIDCDYLPGCALLVRAELFRGLRGFDESYFAYMEDVDFGVRARAAGARLRAVPESKVFHAPSSATGGGYSRGRKYANALNSVRFLRRHGGALRWVAFVVFDVLALPFVWAAAALRGGDPGAVAAKARGLWDGLRGRQLDGAALARWRAGAEGTSR